MEKEKEKNFKVCRVLFNEGEEEGGKQAIMPLWWVGEKEEEEDVCAGDPTEEEMEALEDVQVGWQWQLGMP